MPFPHPGRALLVAVATVALAACSAPAPSPVSTPPFADARATPCGATAAAIVDAVQDYVDSFAGVAAADAGTAAVGSTRLRQEAVRLRAEALQRGCSGADFANLVRAELGRLTGGTAVQDAVAATFRADPLGTINPADPGRREFAVTSPAQLLQAVQNAGDESVIRLAAGTYALDTPLVILRPITLVGAGRDSTEIVSRAAEATIVMATRGTVGLQTLTLTHAGQRAASVAVVASGGYDLRGVRITGARSAKGVGGFGLVLRPSESALDAQPQVQRLRDLTVTDNAGGGIVAAGRQAPTIESVTVGRTSGCALCFIEDATGRVSNATITQAGVGVRVDHRAAPEVQRVRMTATQVGIALSGSGTVRVTDADLTGGAIGVQSTGSATLHLSRARVRDSSQVGIRLSGTGTTLIADVGISGSTPVGVAVVEQAKAQLTGGSIQSTGEAGLVWGDKANGFATGTVLRGQRLGIQLSDATRVDLTDVTSQGRDAALFAGGTSAGSVSRLRCGAVPVVLRDLTTVRLRESPTCSVVRADR